MIALTGIALQDKIYESSNSLVYRGNRVQDGLAIVIKLLKQDYPSPQELTRYRQEYEVTRSLSIEGVIKAHSQQNYQRTLFILLEDFGGESLEHWIRQQSDFCPMPLFTFLRLAIAITDTLGKIHAAHVIHKDINPSNIVFNPRTGIVKIIDFGIATRFSRTNPTFKSLHLLEGTPAYLSPEQTGRMNRMLDYRTDFYSLGVTFYELLTGQLPFPTQDILELVHCHIAKPPIPPHEVEVEGCGVWGVRTDGSSSTRHTIPQAVSDIVMKLMAKNVEDRYQSAWGIKADLERCAQQLKEMGQINPLSLGLQDVSEQFCIPQKLYGRETEIEALLAAFDRLVATDFVTDEADDESVHCAIQSSASSVSHPLPMMLLVSGYAGIGKTALVQELYKPITAKHGYFISGKFDQFGRNVPYSAIVDALQKLVQQLLGEPDEQVQQWRSRLLTALGSNGQIIIDVIPEVELIIGKQPPVPEVGATEAQNRFNLTFQRFVRVFCTKEHPLVIFLDDLQWIDSATLKLIELILLDEQTQYLFLIGAYRNNEVIPTHPLILTLESLRSQGAILQEIILTPLTLEPLSQLIAGTLHHNPDTVRSLAQAVSRKTEGNPFFVGEFLKLLYDENLLTFDAQQLSWQWNLVEIEAQDITDNVVELLLRQLQKLPKATQQILCLAACVGAEFDLETLAIVCEKSPKAIFQDLLAAIQAGLIQPLSDLDEDLLVQEYKFSHDRVQQAAYALIDPSQKHIVHLQIGRNLLEKTAPEQLTEGLFEIVDHLNYGIELVSDQAERDEIARLNLLAGQRAKGAIAYTVAKNYLATGRAWLTASGWQTHYDLTLALYSETTEVAYLCGNFTEVESWMAIVLQEAKTVLDTVKAYEVKIQTYMAQSQPLKAIDLALQVLKQLGICFPEKPSQSDIQLELDAIASLLSEKSMSNDKPLRVYEDLSDLPQMTEPNKLAVMQILSRITLAAWIAAPDLMPLLVSKQVNLSIQYGNALVSLFAYALYGTILCGIVGNIESGYQFGQLALKLLSQSNLHSLRARTLFVVNIAIIHWKKPEREKLQPLLEGYHSGLETGDLEFAAYCAQGYSNQTYFIGKELVEVERNMATYSEAIRQIKQEVALTWIQIFQQTTANLMGRSIDPYRLVGKFYNEENGLSHHSANDGTAICCFYLSKLFLHYLLSEYGRAVEYATIGESYLSYVAPTNIIVMSYLYNSLARLATYSESSAQVQSEILTKVASFQEKMKQWAHSAPMNYLHKYYLVEAEKARVLGQFFEAEEFYERAISGAAEHEFIQDEALAYELAAKHYLVRGRSKIAQTYMKEAHYCYDRWGATAKVKDLEKRYPQLLNSNLVRQSNLTLTDRTIRHPTAAIDLAAVMKAAQALSEIIHLDQLIATLMQVVIENAGAETGALILLEDDRLTVVAQCSGSRQCYLEKIPVAGCATIPVSVIHSVERTQATLVFDDAVSESSFLTDPYIQNQQTRSLLCMPILKQNQLIGMLYLENNLSAGVFTSDRLQVLKLLIAQAAISLENARLYERLEDYSKTLEKKVEERTQALQQEITERQQTEAALRQSEANYRNLIQTANSVIIRFDTQGRIRYINDCGLEFFGYEEHQILGRTLLETIIPETETSGRDLKPFVHNLLRNPQSYLQTEGENLCRDGRRVWVAWSNQAILNEQGQLAEILSVGHDITQRKQAEEALQRSEAKFRNIFENSQVGIFRTRLSDGLILDANQRFADLFGFDSPEEVIGKKQTTDCYVNSNDRQKAVELLKWNDELRNFEVQLRKRDGTLFWGLYSSRLNAADGYLEGVIADISDRKQAEVALQASEAELRALFSAIPDPLCVVTAEGRVIETVAGNPSQLYSPVEEKIGKTLHQIFEKEQADEFMNYIQQTLRTQQVLTVEYSLQIAGRKTWFSARIAPIQHKQVIWLSRDITLQKQAEAASILEERNRMAREIHDTLAQAFTGILAQVGAANQVLTDDLEATQAHLDLIKELARTGLTEARRSVVALRPQLLEEGSLQSALHRLVAQTRAAATDTTLYYEIKGAVYSLPTEVESNLLRIGQEAITNAIRHANADEIRVELVYDRDRFCLRVQDNGQGFGVGSIPSSEGFGLLGMSERAERISAQLTIRSQPGQGTEIMVVVGV